MALQHDELLQQLINAGRNLGEEVWGRIEIFALPEFEKLATQIVAIGRDIEVHGPEGAKILLQMQVDATVGVIAGMTELTRLAVQRAINEILAAVRDFVNAALPIPLIR
jgi:hypothetical protein